MTKREHKYHTKKKIHHTILDMLTENIRKAIDDEILITLLNLAKGNTNTENDFSPFEYKKTK